MYMDKENDEAFLPIFTEDLGKLPKEMTLFPMPASKILKNVLEIGITGIYLDEQGNLCGLYILHPSNVGRCGHICSASFALSQDQNKTQISEALVKHCIMIARAMNYRILQFDAAAESNTNARTLYERLGFHPLGTIPNGFRMKDGRYENICPYYFSLGNTAYIEKISDSKEKHPTNKPSVIEISCF